MFSLVTLKKSSLEASIEWYTKASIPKYIEKQIITIHSEAFLDAYRPYSENVLGLKDGLSKKDWFDTVISEELKGVKQGHLHLATIHLQNSVAGFVICESPKARGQNLKIDVYVSTLAIKPMYDFLSIENKKIQIGLGQNLLESVVKRFRDANTITLDARHINGPAKAFYEKLGFTSTQAFMVDANYYIGYEKAIPSYSR